jgi:hypothetical protein
VRRLSRQRLAGLARSGRRDGLGWQLVLRAAGPGARLTADGAAVADEPRLNLRSRGLRRRQSATRHAVRRHVIAGQTMGGQPVAGHAVGGCGTRRKAVGVAASGRAAGYAGAWHGVRARSGRTWCGRKAQGRLICCAREHRTAVHASVGGHAALGEVVRVGGAGMTVRGVPASGAGERRLTIARIGRGTKARPGHVGLMIEGRRLGLTRLLLTPLRRRLAPRVQRLAAGGR